MSTPDDLLEKALHALAAKDLDAAAEWLSAARVAADRPTVYPFVKGAIEVAGIKLMLARGEVAAVRAMLPALIERQRRTPTTEFPLPLIEIDLALTAKHDGIPAAREAFARWERIARSGFGPNTGVHDAMVRAGVRSLVAVGAVEEARADLATIVALLERRSIPVSEALRALAAEIA